MTLRRYRHPAVALVLALVVVAILLFAVAMSWHARHRVRAQLTTDAPGAVVPPP